MSVLIEKINKKIYKGEPPANVLNVDIKTKLNGAIIKWTDPEDTIIGGISLSTWKGTILVRKKDSAPSNINDGVVLVDNTERNKYSVNGYEDNNLEDGNYYYRFFTYSTTYIYNDDSNMIYNINIINIDPILKNNTWEQIANAVKSGNIPSTWKIGDEKDLVLKGTFNETVTMQIWDFKHFVKSNGTGKAGICFGMKHLMKDKQQMNSTYVNYGGWNRCDMRNTVINNIFNSMPPELKSKSYIKEVNTYANIGGANQSSQLCTDNIFLPGYTECGGTLNNYDGDQVKFPIFTDNNSRIKRLNNGSGETWYWWNRSPDCNKTEYFYYLAHSGVPYSDIANASFGVCFCFNI